MGTSLINLVEGRLDSDGGVSDEVAGLIFQALTGDKEPEVVDLRNRARDGGFNRVGATPPNQRSGPLAQVFLSHVTVEGFRGVGSERSISLTAGPGLTLICGANGSGKSSFAEAVELLVTDECRRWSLSGSATADAQWQNKHHRDRTRVAARFVVPGLAGELTLSRTWAEGAAPSNPSSRAAVVAGGGDTSPAELGWPEALLRHRPFLSYNELGSAIGGKPAALYDAMAAGLGVAELNRGIDDLEDRHSARAEEVLVAGALLVGLRQRLDEALGERAQTLAGMLGEPAPDLAEIEQFLAATQPETSRGSRRDLEQLVGLVPPDRGEVTMLAEQLLDAEVELLDAGSGSAQDAIRRADMLAAALDVFEHSEGWAVREGERVCPVCDTGVLDAGWPESVRAEVPLLRNEARRMESAIHELERLVAIAHRLIAQHCTPLDVDCPDIDLAALNEERRRWGDAPDAVFDLAAHLEAVDRLVELTEEVAAAARTGLASRHEEWVALLPAVGAWVEAQRLVDRHHREHLQLGEAKDWLISARQALIAEQFAPMARQAAYSWARLRSGSSIDLAEVALEGSADARKVVLPCAIDGEEADATGVMSQGELHALSLSLFIPRALASHSPFGFVIIDDPVQAMDPVRVDGLADLLDEMASRRQVVVFSHDERLAAAIQRRGIAARVLQLNRGNRSEVEVVNKLWPWDQYLDDARAIANDPELPERVARRVMPNLCRKAIEAAATEVAIKQGLARERPLSHVMSEVSALRGTEALLAAAFWGDASQSKKVYARLHTALGPTSGDLVKTCSEGCHDPNTVPRVAFVDEAERLVRYVTRDLTC